MLNEKEKDDTKSIRDLLNEIYSQKDADSLSRREYDALQNRIESTSKAIERFIKNAFSALGIELAKYTNGKKYKLDKCLSKMLSKRIQEFDFPTEKQIKEAYEHVSPLSVECLDIIKHFNDANFDRETYEEVTKKIKIEKDKMYEKFVESLDNQQKALADFHNYKLALIGRSISLDEIDIFLSEVYRCYAEKSRDENEFITERDIMLINFLKLPNMLKEVNKKITDEIIANNIYNFMK